jgi:hypothetical protein
MCVVAAPLKTTFGAYLRRAVQCVTELYDRVHLEHKDATAPPPRFRSRGGAAKVGKACLICMEKFDNEARLRRVMGAHSR